MGCSPLGHKELDTTEQLSTAQQHSPPGKMRIHPEIREDKEALYGWGRSPGEGNGYPIQYSCLENSMVRGAYGPWGRKKSDTTEPLLVCVCVYVCMCVCVYIQFSCSVVSNSGMYPGMNCSMPGFPVHHNLSIYTYICMYVCIHTNTHSPSSLSIHLLVDI